MNSDFFNTIARVSLYGALFIPFIVTSSTFFPYIVGKNVAFRICASIAALAFAGGLWLKRESIEHYPTVMAFVGFTAIMFLAALFGADPAKSFFSNFERMEGWLTLAALSIYLVALVLTFRKESDWRMFLMTTLGISTIIALAGIYELFATQQGSAARIDGTLGNAAYLGVYALFHVWIAILLIYDRVRDFSSNIREFLKKTYSDLVIMLFFIPALFLNLGAMYFSQTRSVMLGLIAGGIVMAGILAIRLPQKHILKNISTVVLIFIIVFGGAFFSLRDAEFIQQSPTLSRFANISLDDATTRSRIILWEVGYNAFLERPVLGWGQENFIHAFGKYYDPRMYDQEEWFDRAHNVFFDWLTQGGILGLFAYLAIFFAGIWSLYKSKTIQLVEKSIITGLLVSYFINNFFVFDNITSYLLFIIILGYIAVRSNVVIVKTSDTSGLFLAIANATIALLVALSAVLAWHSGTSIIAGFQHLNGGRVAESARAFDVVASRVGTGQQEAVEQLALNVRNALSLQSSAEDKKIFVDIATNAYANFQDHNPPNGRLFSVGGPMFRILGMNAESLEEYKKAYELMPKKQTASTAYAESLMHNNQQEEALKIISSAYEITLPFNLGTTTPQFNLIKSRYIAALILTGNNAEAETLLRAGTTNLSFEIARLLISVEQQQKGVALLDDLLKNRRDELRPVLVFEMARLLISVEQQQKGIALLDDLLMNGINQLGFNERMAIAQLYYMATKVDTTIMVLTQIAKDFPSESNEINEIINDIQREKR